MTDTDLYRRWVQLRWNLSRLRSRRKVLPDGTTDKGAYRNKLRDERAAINVEWHRLETARFRGDMTDPQPFEWAVRIIHDASKHFFVPIEVEVDHCPQEMRLDVDVHPSRISIRLKEGSKLAESEWERFVIAATNAIARVAIIDRHWRRIGGYSIEYPFTATLEFQTYFWRGPGPNLLRI